MRFPTLFSLPYSHSKGLYTRISASLLSLLLAVTVQAQRLSPSEAADSARNHTGGKVLKVKSPQGGNNTDYRIKVLLPQGKVRNVTVDGNSGKVRQPSPKDKKR